MKFWVRANHLRRSLAPRVIFSTILLSLIVVLITGTALNSLLSDGIQKVKIESSIDETRSAVFNAQYRFYLSEGAKTKVIRQIIEDVVINSATLIGTSPNGREVAFLLTSSDSKNAKKFETTSNLILPSSVPVALRVLVQKNDLPQWSKTKIISVNGKKISALVVGRKVIIPKIGKYEMYLLFSLENQNVTLNLLRNSLLMTGLVLLALIGLITWLVVRQVVRPVKEASRIAELFATGDFNQRMKFASTEELARLGIAFNEMAASLQIQIVKLENLSQVQQRFVSDVSHELRTPLTTLQMAADVIHTAKKDFDPSVARSAELMVAQLERFDRLLEDLLEVSRFDAEVAVLESANVDIFAMITRCVDDLQLLAAQRSVLLEIKAPSQSIFLEADARRVERILRNLISNAIEYADAKPVEISIVESEDSVAVGVRDHGLGMEEASVMLVFNRFWRADPSRARIRGGTGLGLSIALEDARLHHGELEAWGRPGKGAHFVMTLPKKAGGQIQARLIALQPKDYSSTPL